MFSCRSVGPRRKVGVSKFPENLGKGRRGRPGRRPVSVVEDPWPSTLYRLLRRGICPSRSSREAGVSTCSCVLLFPVWSVEICPGNEDYFLGLLPQDVGCDHTYVYTHVYTECIESLVVLKYRYNFPPTSFNTACHLPDSSRVEL